MITRATFSMRDFISRLDNEGLLRRVTEKVHWKYEIGEMTRQVHVPMLFENIDGYPGCGVFTNGLVSSEAIALALGLNRRSSLGDMARIALGRIASRVPPVLASGASTRQNFISGGDVDLSKFPVPWWSPKDAGRYVGTWHLNVTRDPETGVRNVGVYRMMLLGRDTATLSVYPGSHIARHISKADELGKSLEMAVVIGVDERLIIAAAAGPGYGVDEYDLAGALAENPLILSRCATIGLEVPTDAEIVIEGSIEPGVRVADGPFLDYAGIATTNLRARLFRASAIQYRDNVVFRGTSVGRPGAEDHLLYSLLAYMDLFDFHGSRLKRKFQRALLKRGMYRLYQLAGRLRS